MSEFNVNVIKDHWPWFLGGVVGLWLISKYSGGRKTAVSAVSSLPVATQDNSVQLASIAAQQALAQAQLDAQKQASDQAAVINYNNSVSGMASSAANSIANIIAAQSQLPASAIDSASKENQAALLSAAQVAGQGFGALAAGMNAQANQIMAQGQTVAGIATAQAMQLAAQGQAQSSIINSLGNFFGNEYKATVGLQSVDMSSLEKIYGSTIKGVSDLASAEGLASASVLNMLNNTASSVTNASAAITMGNTRANSQFSNNLMQGGFGLASGFLGF